MNATPDYLDSPTEWSLPEGTGSLLWYEEMENGLLVHINETRGFLLPHWCILNKFALCSFAERELGLE
jgi:hypothetical protein